jgi:hypothetical protein
MRTPRRTDRRPRGPQRRSRGPRALVALGALVALSLAVPAVSGASVPTALTSLHKVAGWVSAGLKLKVATSGVKSQLSENALAWIPETTCMTDALNSDDAMPCVIGDTSSSTTVVLYGDSSAAEWALDLGALYAHAACPVGDIIVELEGHSVDPTCAPNRADVLADLAAMQPPPALVIVSELRLDGYETSTGAPVTNTAWSSAFATTIEQIQGDGLAVASLHGVPFDQADPATCIAANLDKLTACEIKAKDEDVNKWDAATKAGAIDAKAASLNFNPLFCTSTGCPAVIDGAVTHSGGNHVTQLYAGDVTKAFGELLGCLTTQKFTNQLKAAQVFDDLNGAKPSKAFIAACKTLKQ